MFFSKADPGLVREPSWQDMFSTPSSVMPPYSRYKTGQFVWHYNNSGQDPARRSARRILLSVFSSCVRQA